VLLSADSSVESNADDSPHRSSSSGHVVSTTANTSSNAGSLSSLEFCISDKKHRGKRRPKTAQKSNTSDSHAATPSVVTYLNKQCRFKRRLSLDEVSVVKSGASVMQGQLNCSLSQTLPLAGDSHRKPEELRVRKHRQLKRSLTLDSSEHGEAVLKKRRRKSAIGKKSQTRKKILEDMAATVAVTQVQAVRDVPGNDVEANGVQTGSSAAGNSTVSSSAPVPTQLCVQNLSTGARYVLQPVAKASLNLE